MQTSTFFRLLNEVGLEDLDSVDGKNASLGEMIQHMTHLGINIPDGFVVALGAYNFFLNESNVGPAIKTITGKIDFDNVASLRKGGKKIRQLIRNTRFSKALGEEINDALTQLALGLDRDSSLVSHLYDERNRRLKS